MQVIRAEAMGLCFGVRDALESIAAVPDPHHVTVYGELVHNQEVNRDLAERGFRQLAEHSRKQAVPETPVVLITAHGISNEERAWGVRTLQVQSAAELRPAWFQGHHTVGLTAGTSTLDETIEEVHRRLLALAGEAC